VIPNESLLPRVPQLLDVWKDLVVIRLPEGLVWCAGGRPAEVRPVKLYESTRIPAAQKQRLRGRDTHVVLLHIQVCVLCQH
jgi:hypothetical protein